MGIIEPVEAYYGYDLNKDAFKTISLRSKLDASHAKELAIKVYIREDLVEELMENAQKATQSILRKDPSKYHRNIKGASVDVYDVLNAYEVTNPAVQHAVKKLLQAGNRGHKDRATDLKEALQSIERAIELENDDEN
jgi:hypothetical protein